MKPTQRSLIELDPSFSLDPLDLPPYCHWAVEGWERAGKSDFACSAPGPIAYIAFDRNAMSPVNRWRGRGKVIHFSQLFYDVPRKAKAVRREDQPSQAEVDTYAQYARGIYRQFKANWEWALKSEEIRTIIIDTEYKLWALIRLARYGRLTQVPQMAYPAKLNPEMFGYLNAARESQRHTLWLRRLTPEYKDAQTESGTKLSKATGGLVPDGFKHTSFELQATLRVYRDEEFNWGVTVRDSTVKGSLAGKTFEGKQRTFRHVAAAMYGNKPEDWK